MIYYSGDVRVNSCIQKQIKVKRFFKRVRLASTLIREYIGLAGVLNLIITFG